jgi:hypothetical protein
MRERVIRVRAQRAEVRNLVENVRSALDAREPRIRLQEEQFLRTRFVRSII